jgi:hypothetical protein
MLKLAVTVYGRPEKTPIWSRIVLGDTLLRAAGFRHSLPAWGFAESGIVVICTPDWEPAVSEFLAGQRGDENVSAAEADNGAWAGESEPRGARAQSASAKPQR